jgi:hypothetical protein
MARATTQGTPHRSSGKFALHVLETMFAILEAGETRRAVEVGSQIQRPLALGDDEALGLLKGTV